MATTRNLIKPWYQMVIADDIAEIDDEIFKRLCDKNDVNPRRQKVVATLGESLQWQADWPCTQLLADKIMEDVK